KNGVATNLTNGAVNANANALFVSGSDVYVGGMEDLEARIWKNGVGTNVSGGFQSRVNSIFVSGNDVYAAGWLVSTTEFNAVIWKNGTLTKLTDGSKYAGASSVYVANNDVYVGGYEYNNNTDKVLIAKMWKNGIAINLIDGIKDALV